MTLMEIVQELANGYEFETSSWVRLFGYVKGKMINLKEDITDELFSNIFTKICELLGTPVYVHSYYGYIWKVNGEIFAYNNTKKIIIMKL